MEKITVLDWVRKVLEEEQRPMSAQEIAEAAIKKGWKTKGKTPDYSIMSVIYVDLRDNPETLFEKTQRPVKFYLKHQKKAFKNLKETESIEDVEDEKKGEFILYPILCRWLHAKWGVYTKIINDKQSKKRKKGDNEWLHPDVVGVHISLPKTGLPKWREETWELAKEMGANLVKLYSFEVKKELYLSNLKKSFFQALSNSSWANESYLVAEIFDDENPEFETELKRLSTGFGIGVIKLNKEDTLSKSEVKYQAYSRYEINWDTINKLLPDNPNFETFIKQVTKDLKTRSITQERYEPTIEE